MAPNIETRWFDIYGHVATTGESIRSEEFSAALNRWFDLYAFRVGEAEEHKVAVLFNDITGRRRTEEALRRSEAQLTQAVRVGQLGIFEHDHLNDVLECSALARQLMHFDPTETVTLEGLLERVRSEDRDPVQQAIHRAHDPAGDGMFEVEFRVAAPDVGIRWVRARSQTFFDAEGAPRRALRTIGAVQDVTEQKESQAKLERLVAERTARLQELVGELEHFSYTITHDMRAPLRAMQGFAEMLIEDVCGACQEAQSRHLLRRIRTAAERMDCLIRDALNYSTAVRQELPLEPIDAGALLRGMLETYPEYQTSQAAIALRGDLPLVMGNRAGLTQCFSNLLGNAVKFVKPGQKPNVSVWAERQGEWVRLWIEDEGIGIPTRELPRIFKMFGRGHQGYEGTGIGLALVRKVAEKMSGKVGVESEEGKGSRFWVDLKPVP